MKGYGQYRECERCGDVLHKGKMVWCSICRKWFCEPCHQNDHSWQCEEKKKCHCCKKPAMDKDGKPKTAPICWDCICHGGSVERKCNRRRHPSGKAKDVPEWIFDMSRGQVDEDEIREFVGVLQERPLSSMARIAVKSRHLPCGIPERADVLEALEGAKAYLKAQVS